MRNKLYHTNKRNSINKNDIQNIIEQIDIIELGLNVSNLIKSKWVDSHFDEISFFVEDSFYYDNLELYSIYYNICICEDERYEIPERGVLTQAERLRNGE